MAQRSEALGRDNARRPNDEQEAAVSVYLEALQKASKRNSAPLSGPLGHPTVDVPDDIRRRFVAHAKEYGARHGIEYETWREVGVPVQVLAGAGIVPARS